MLTVTSLSGLTESIDKYSGFEINEMLDGGLTLSFISYLHEDNPGHILIENESITEYEDRKFRVKQLRTNSVSKKVIAVSTYYDNAEIRKYDTYGGTHTLDEFLTYTLSETGWTFINEDVTISAVIPNFGNDNVIKLVDIIKAAFGCEMKIEPNNVLRFATKLGPDNDEQYRYGHNIRSLAENIDTTNLKTYIEGFGANGIHISYTSPNSTIFGIRHAEPIADDSILSEEVMLERLKAELIDYPETSIELDAIELQEKEIGERVWLFHEKMGIEYQTRVISKKTRIPKSLSSVVLGNRLPQRLSDILISQKVDIDKNKKETRSRFEQTNDRITLEVEEIGASISLVEVRVGQVELGVSNLTGDVDTLDNRVTTAEANILINAGEITLKATSQSVTTLEGVLAALEGDVDVINTNLTAVTTRVNSAEIDIDGLNSSIALKASSESVTTLTGRVDGIDTSMTNITVRMSSAEVDIDGLQGEIALKASTSVTDSLGSRVDSAEINISSLNGSISSKVSNTDYNGNTIASLLNQTATSITLDAQMINMLGITNVANTLNIGTSFTDQSTKTIAFRGTLGGVSISSPGYTDSLGLHALNEVFFDTGLVSFRENSTIDIPSNTTVNGLYARFG